MSLKNYFIEDHWKIGYVDKPISEIISDRDFFKKISWIPADKNIFLADPFWSGTNDFDSIFCESFDLHKQIGSIVKINGIKSGNYSFQSVLNDSSHYSFPSVFEHNNKRMLTPENSATGKLNFYEIEENYKLKFSIDIAAVDPVLFFRDQKFYLFCSILDGSQNDKLELFLSDQLEGPWEKHPESPIHVSKNGSRMAGNLFQIDGKIFRPGQLSSNNYGGGIALYQIRELSQKNYAEELVKVFLPPADYSGIHTINSFGNGTIFDVKIEKFHFLKPIWRIKQKYFRR